jgi:hypothetical protein
MRAGRLRFIGAAVLGGLLLGAALAETGARVLAPSAGEELLFSAPDAVPEGLYRASPTLLNEPVPGFMGQVASMGYRVPVRINALGLRGGEPTGARRWLALGDSFTIALQVPEADTFEARVGAALGVEVLNGGVDGYSTAQATRRYEALDGPTGAEAVLLTFFLGNDFHDNERIPPLLNGPPPPGAGGHAPVRASTDPLSRFLLRHSVAYAYWRVAQKRAALSAADDFDTRRFREELTIFTRGGAGRLAQLRQASAQALTALRDAARQRGDRLLVAVAPPSFAVDPERAAATLATFGLDDPDVDAPRRAALDVLQQLGIPSCDLTPPLQAAQQAGREGYFRFDGHWTAVGHAVVADTIVDCAGR